MSGIIETLVTSSVLIAVIMVVRTLFKGKLRSTARYALWLIAAARLVLPFSLTESAVSVMNLADNLFAEETAETSETSETPTREKISSTEPDRVYYTRAAESAPTTVQTRPAAPYSEYIPEVSKPFPWKKLAIAAYAVIACGMLIYFIGANVVYYVRLRKVRKPLDYPAPLRVYTVPEPASPCIFGLFRPAIYIPENVSGNRENLEYIVTHEMCHYRHGDLFWTVLRYVLVSAYWFDPFVWAAAVLSKRDCECACDEAAIKRLGEERRFRYGKAIVDLIPRKRITSLGIASTSMASPAKVLKERMTFIAAKPANKRYAVFFSAVILVAAAGCTFTSAASDTPADEPAVPAIEPAALTAEVTEAYPAARVTDYTGAARTLVYVPAQGDSREPYISADWLAPAKTAAYSGRKISEFIENSRFSEAEVSLDGGTKRVTDLTALTAAFAELEPEYADVSPAGESFAMVKFSMANGGFSSALTAEFRDSEQGVLGKVTADDYSDLVTLVLSGDATDGYALEKAYQSSVRMESGYFFAEDTALYGVVCPTADYEQFGTDWFSGDVLQKLEITGETPRGYVGCEYGGAAFCVPTDGSVNRFKDVLLWQNGGESFKITSGGTVPSGTNVISGQFDGQLCAYRESGNTASLTFSAAGNVYTAEYSGSGDPAKIFGSIHAVPAGTETYIQSIRISSEPSPYGDENYHDAWGLGKANVFRAGEPAMLDVSFCLTYTGREYETNFDCYIEKKEPDGNWYRVIPLEEVSQANTSYRHFYTKDESGRIPACLDLACYPLLPAGEYRLVKPYREAGADTDEYAAFYDFTMSDSMTGDDSLLCTAECSDKDITPDTREIAYTVSANNAVLAVSEVVDIERLTDSGWQSVRKAGIRTNSLHAGYPPAVSGTEYRLSTADFDISQSGRYRIRISYGSCDDELTVPANGYGTAYAEFTVEG